MIRALVAALVFVVAFTVGVGVGRWTAPPRTQSSPGAAAYVGLSELGATEVQWAVPHKPDPRDPDASFVLRNLAGLDGFVNVTFESGRVSGFIMQFKAGTLNETAAKVITREELPADARLVFDSRKYLGATDIDDQCDLLQYQSPTIGTLFAQHREGIVNVVLWSPGPQGLLSTYDPASVTSINFLATGTLGEIPDEC